MHAEFGEGFRLLDSVREDHQTPAGITQAFVYCLCRVEADSAPSRPLVWDGWWLHEYRAGPGEVLPYQRASPHGL